MQQAHFEAVVKNGYIKLPKDFFGFDNKKVFVEIIDLDREMQEEEHNRVRKMEAFLDDFSGILKYAELPGSLDSKAIKEMRLKEKYDI